MRHLPYPKIATRVPDGARASGQWVATEKIHGANLVVATDGERVRIGKRKAWLADDAPFFGWQRVRVELEMAALAVHRAVHRWAGAGIVRIYGELFGGAYPHPDVPPVSGLSAVQTGVWYTPDLRFAAFDMLLEPRDGDSALLAHSEVEQLAARADLLVVPTLGRGRHADVLQLPVRYPSRVSRLLGLPDIADNLAEGYVMKPDVRCPPAERATVKRKIAEFDERRFYQSAPFAPDQRLTAEQITEIALGMVNPPRIASARSKLGQVPADALVTEIVLDILVDIETVYPVAYAALGTAEEPLRQALEAHVSAATESTATN